MPLTRYQIRNECSLADPELYRAADKDDPEALLEGVAMAGLVGVLRQLGDLAEFAAEIFHDLHEEVMATATRGHGLTIRVHQLEAEFPSVEKAILSQTSHTSFLHNAGFEWHPNLQMDQNLITSGDLPRFIMDSYEECRGPPRLFLLDKFDIAGAGACLKRYSDPSFFKAEFTTLKSTKSDDKREKRTRKTKKKALHLRNGETPEVIQTSHSKLHDLFLVERSQAEDSNIHKHRVKLKRRQSNCSLVDSTTRKSYMERILDCYSPNGKVFSGSSATSLHSKMGHGNSGELVPEIHEVCAGSPANKLVQKDRSQVPSPTRQEKVQDMFIDELGDEIIKEGISEELTKSAHEMELERTLLTICKAGDQKGLVVDGERKIEVSADGYKSDDVNSEIDNYMDALTTMESEMETDSESRPRNECGFNIEKKWIGSNVTEEQKETQARFSDSHSMGSSQASDDGNNSLKKGRFSLSYSDSVVNFPENVLSDGDAEARVHPSTEFFLAETVDVAAEKISGIPSVPGTISSKCAIPNGICDEAPEVPHHESEFEEKTFNSCVPVSSFTSSSGPGACSNDVQLLQHDTDEFSSDFLKPVTEVSLSNGEENGENVSVGLPCGVNVSNLPSPARDDVLSVGSHGEQLVQTLKGSNPDVSHDATMHWAGSLDLTYGKADANYDTFEEFLPKHDAEYGSVETPVKDGLDLQDSVALSTDNCLAEQELAAHSVARSPVNILDSPLDSDCNGTSPSGLVVETESIVQSGKKPECLTSVLECKETGNFPERKYLEMTDEVPTHQLDLAEVRITKAETEILDEKLASNTSDCVIKDGSALDKVHLNYCDAEKNSDVLDFSNQGAASDSAEAELAGECPLGSTNLATGTINAAVDDKDKLTSHRPINSSEDEKKLQEQCISGIEGLEHDKLEVADFSNLNYSKRLNDQKETENQPSVISSVDDLELSYFESNHLSGSPIINDVHDQVLVGGSHKHSQLCDDSQVLSSAVDRNQECELKHSLSVGTEDCVTLATHLIPEPELPLQQGLEMSSDQTFVESLHKVEGCQESSYKQSEQNEFPNFSDGSLSATSKSLPEDPLSNPSDPNLLPLQNDSHFGGSEPFADNLYALSHSFCLLNEANHPLEPQPHRPLFGLLPLNHDDPKVQETPPLPPLPPLQWRMGKLQHGSLPSEGIMAHCSNPFSAPPTSTADAIAHQDFPNLDGEFFQSPNPFLTLPDPDEEKAQNISLVLQGEMMSSNLNPTSLSVQALENEKIQCDYQALELSTAQHHSPLIPRVNEETQHVCSELGGELSQPTSSNVRTASLTSEGEQEQPLNSLASMLQGEDEKVGQNSRTSGDTVQLPNSSARTTVEHENSQHVSLVPQGELSWQSDKSADALVFEDGKPNGNLKSRLARPMDPLIEAVASHNKSNLRKVVERVQSEITPRVEERDSLLEQIRTKSFNLKPATVTRPSIQGPRTNLKVVAILEKANAIRQALAGSDDEDDDEDGWSDT